MSFVKADYEVVHASGQRPRRKGHRSNRLGDDVIKDYRLPMHIERALIIDILISDRASNMISTCLVSDLKLDGFG